MTKAIVKSTGCAIFINVQTAPDETIRGCRRRTRRRTRRLGPRQAIAVGILIAAAVIFVGLHIYGYLVVQAAEKTAAEFMQQAQRELNSSAAETRARMEARRKAERAAAERRSTAELERRRAIAQRTQAVCRSGKVTAGQRGRERTRVAAILPASKEV